MRTEPRGLSLIGPGILVAATGVGAGDLVTATLAGTGYGPVLMWAALVGAVLKFTLNENLARWQIITGQTLLDGWRHHLHPAASWYFIGYLFLWSFSVAAALMAACGLAGHSLFPALSVGQWGAIHSVVALLLVARGSYRFVEKIMGFLIGLMFVTVLLGAWLHHPPLEQILAGLFLPRIPENSLPFVLGLIGGVGGSVTLLSYGYWIREKGWNTKPRIATVRIDLAIAYILTTLFALGIIAISSGVEPGTIKGTGIITAVASQLGSSLGPLAEYAFLVGFWGAVFSSMLGVWHGVPYLFADFTRQRATRPSREDQPLTTSLGYRGYLLYLALPPLVMLVVDRPVWIILLYAVAGAFFMPFLAITLLYLNGNRTLLGEHRNRTGNTLLLSATLLLFMFLLVHKLIQIIMA